MASIPVDQQAKSEPTSPAASASAKQAKKSQRPSWSCTECTRRKIRCDRVVPGCNQCIKRNKVHLCRLDQDEKIGFGPEGVEPVIQQPIGEPRFASAAEFEAIQRNLTVVRQRLFHLERVVGAFVPRPDVLDAAGQPTWAVDMNLLQNGGTMGADAYPSSAATPATSSAPLPAPSGDYYAPVPGPSQYTVPAAPPAALAVHDFESQQQQQATSLPQYSRQSSGLTVEDDGEVEAAVTLEYLALGRDGKSEHVSRGELRRPAAEGEEQPGPSTAGLPSTTGLPNGHSSSASAPHPPPSTMDDLERPPPPAPAPAPPPSLADILPPQPTANAIIAYSLERVGWQHGAVHAGQFRAECAEFDSWGPARADKVNPHWLALYFSVLCVGARHMSADDARACGLASEDQRVLPRLFFEASVEALHRGQFLAQHSIFAVQTIVILVISCQDVGGSDLIATLLACGIRIAQHLQISRLGSDEEWDRKRRLEGVDPQSEAGVKGLIQREVRKRLWYALATEDWLSVPFRRAYSIFPSHFTTPPPLNCHDEDLSAGVMLNRPQDEPTCVSKTLVAHKVASCIRRFFEDVNSRPDRELSYDLLLDVDSEIRAIISEGPAFLRADERDIEQHPPWVRWMLHWWIMSVSHKLLVCHRVFLGRSFRDAKYAYSRKAAIEAARSIIQELVKGSRLGHQHLWTVPYHAVSAAVAVILDIFQSSSSDPDLVHKRREVQAALDELRLLSEEGNSQIAARGIQLLTTLLAEEARHRRPADTRGKRKAGEMTGSDGAHGSGDPRAESPAKRVVSDRHASLGAPPSHAAYASAPPPHPMSATGSASFPYFQPSFLPPPPPPGALTSPGRASGHLDPTSPLESHVSDTSLTQDAFESILQNLGGWSGGGGGGGGGLEAAFAAATPGASGPAVYAGGGGGGVGAFGGAETGDHAADFFRMLDAGSFDFGGEAGGLQRQNGTSASSGGGGGRAGQAPTPGQSHAAW